MTKQGIAILARSFFIIWFLFIILIQVSQRVLLIKEFNLLFYIIFAIVQTLFLLAAQESPLPKKVKTIIKRLVIIFYSLSALYIIYSIIFIPFGMYVFWIKLIQERSPGGAISELFVWCEIFFFSLFSCLVYHKKLVAGLMGMVLSQCILSSVIIHHFVLVIIIVTLLSASLFFILIIKQRVNNKLKSLFYYSIRILLIIVAAFFISLPTPLYQGQLATLSLLPEVRTFLSQDFPVSPIISTVGEARNNTSRTSLGFPNLNKEPVFRIFGKPRQSCYIRLSAYSSYDDGEWYNNFNHLKIVDNRVIQFNKNQKNADIKIQLLADYYIEIPHTLKSRYISIPEIQPRQFLFASFDYGFRLDLPLTGQNEILIVQEDSSDAHTNELSREQRDLYLQVPAKIKNALTSLVNSENLKTKNDKDTVSRVVSFLKQKYRYSLKPPKAKNQKDFILGFLLETKQGFCQHFSSAFILIVRTMGLPARYVTGYYGIIPANKEYIVINGLSAHAWAEVWLPEQGWITLEATPPLLLSPSQQERLVSQTQDRLTRNQLNSLLQLKADGNPENQQDNYHLILPVILLALAIALGFIILIYQKKIKHRPHYNPDLARTARLFRFLIKDGKRNAISGPEILGWKEWARNFSQKKGLSPEETEELIKIAYDSFFSQTESVENNSSFLKSIKKKIKNKVLHN